MRVKKWVQEGRTKRQIATDLERFDLYLHIEEDAELIEALHKYRKRHRTGQRIRDLLYAGLAAEQSGATAKPRLAVAMRPVHEEAPRQQADDTPEQTEAAADAFLNMFG